MIFSISVVSCLEEECHTERSKVLTPKKKKTEKRNNVRLSQHMLGEAVFSEKNNGPTWTKKDRICGVQMLEQKKVGLPVIIDWSSLRCYNMWVNFQQWSSGQMLAETPKGQSHFSLTGLAGYQCWKASLLKNVKYGQVKRQQHNGPVKLQGEWSCWQVT